jgi:hypothetical protein
MASAIDSASGSALTWPVGTLPSKGFVLDGAAGRGVTGGGAGPWSRGTRGCADAPEATSRAVKRSTSLTCGPFLAWRVLDEKGVRREAGQVEERKAITS